MSKLIKADDIDLTYFWSLNEIYDWLDELAIQYPENIVLESIGKSFEQRDIKAVTITLDRSNVGKTSNIIMDATIHARYGNYLAKNKK